MGKATIIEDLGSGKYTITRNWAGRDSINERIEALLNEAEKLLEKYNAMPQTTFDELFEKNIVYLQIQSLLKKAEYLNENMPVDSTVDAWCADFTEGLTGEVGTIDIAGEFTTDVNIQPGHNGNGEYNGERDGELYPAIALGPWTSFLNQCIYPGWQKFAPLHRYAKIVEDTIDRELNTCVVAVQPTFSLMNFNVNKAATGGGDPPAASKSIKSSRIKNYNINIGDPLGRDEIEIIQAEISERNAARNWFYQDAASTHPGMLDFIERRPDHPISKINSIAPPVWISDQQYIQIERICRHIDYSFTYQSDSSGYEISDHWEVMYEIGDPWYWIPSYKGEPQNEFYFGSIPLEHEPTGLVIGQDELSLDDFLEFGYGLGGYMSPLWFESKKRLSLWVDATGRNEIGPIPRVRGDCEDFALTKMQAIHEAGILDVSNMQILLCYVLGAGYHAVLGINTSNYGYLISDQRDYGQLWQIEQLYRTHFWESFTSATAAGYSAKVQLILKDVPFDYMDCDSLAFADNDDVIIEFEGQSWDNPKVLGFKNDPVSCSAFRLLPDGTGYPYTGDEAPEEEQKGVFSFYYASESWTLAGTFPTDPTLYACCTGTEGIAYRSGGYTLAPFGEFGVKPIYSSNHHSYDVNEESWQSVQSSGNAACRQRYKYLENGKSLLYGGEINTDSQYWGDTITFPADVFYGSMQRYKISQDSWDYKSTGPARSSPAAFVINEIFYVAGGRNTTIPYNNPGEYNENTYAFYESYDTWVNQQSLPAKFGWACGFGFTDKGYIGGGCEIQRYQTTAEITGATLYRDLYQPSNPFNYHNPNPYPIEYCGYCEDDSVFNVTYQWSDTFLWHPPEAVDPDFTVEASRIVGTTGGFVNTGVGLYYDPAQDSWSTGTCHPSYDWTYDGFAHGEIDGRSRGLRMGGGQSGSQRGFLLDPTTDSWSAKGSVGGPGYSKKFSASGIGISA